VPWYWTDDLSRILFSEGLISKQAAVQLETSPVAIRRVETSLEEAVRGMVDDDEVPLAA
jgi:hypothetical protein